MTDGIHSTQHYIKYINKAILAKFRHRPLKFARLIVLQVTRLSVLENASFGRSDDVTILLFRPKIAKNKRKKI